MSSGTEPNNKAAESPAAATEPNTAPVAAAATPVPALAAQEPAVVAAASVPAPAAPANPTAIGILTSGGDSQGMNCVLYGLCKSALNYTDVYLIRNGYQGLVNGGEEFIYKAQIDEIQQSIHQGGTIIGSSRCQEFRDPEGRKKAARNLLIRNIHNLIVIGGDGSLTGANHLRNEWPSVVKEIIEEAKRDGTISKVDLERLSSSAESTCLNIIGIIGSIDNDFNGTEMTVGADSAFARITEAIDMIQTTASSHHRAMVVEVMGRNCGYLALSATLATEATYALLPEYPQPDGWQQKLRSRIEFEQKRDQQTHIIILSEGARAVDGTIIKADTVKAFLTEMGLDTRTVVLGHIQRGGQVTAFDRLMSIQLGIEAFNALKQAQLKQGSAPPGTAATSEALVLTLNDGQIKAKPLLECIDEINQLNRKMLECEWSSVVEQRGKHFVNTWQNFCQLMSSGTNQKDQPAAASANSPSAWAVVHLAKQPVPGMNSALAAIVRYGEAMKPKVAKIYAVQNGIEGLVQNRLTEMNWGTVSGYVSVGGSVIGCYGASSDLNDHAITAQNIDRIVETLDKRGVDCLCFIGDHLSLKAIKQLKGQSSQYERKYPRLQQLKVCFLPATVGPSSEDDEEALNNPTGGPSESWIVCSSSKLGYDSLLNKVCQLLTDLHQSQLGTFNRLFMAKLRINMTAMANDFYRPSLFALANGAAHIYPCHRSHLASQTKLDVKQTEIDASDMKNKMLNDHRNQLIIVHEPFFQQTLEIFQKQFGTGDCLKLVTIDLTNLQQPHKPTPYDRKFGVKLGMQCANYFSDNVGSSVTSPASTLASRSISSLAGTGTANNPNLTMVNSNFEIVPLSF